MPIERTPRSPLPANYVPAGGRQHKVSTDETLVSIARNNGLSEAALCQFNFGTTDPAEINWYLRHRVGCHKATHDGNNWMFTTDARPGVIYLPSGPVPHSTKPVVVDQHPPTIGPAPAVEAGSPDVEFKYTIELPKTKPIGPKNSPVLVTITGKIVLKGFLLVDGARTKVSFEKGKMQADLELRFKEEFGTVKFKTQVKPGEISKVGLEWTSNDIPLSIEFAANADISKPFVLSAKWPKMVTLKKPIKLTQHLAFSGAIEPQIDFIFTPNPLWPGWEAFGRAALQGGRAALQSGAAAIRGVFIAEELGTVTAVGGFAIVGGVALGFVAWTGFGLYQIGKAGRDGRVLAVRYAFASGYSSVLADMTSEYPTSSRSDGERWLSIDWEGSLAKLGSLYVDGGSEKVYGPDLQTIGKAAAAQEIDRYIKSRGIEPWKELCKKHRQRYGASEMDRKARYFQILSEQVRSGQNVLHVPFE